MGKIGLVDTESGMTEAKAWKLAQGDWVVLESLKVDILNKVNPYLVLY